MRPPLNPCACAPCYLYVIGLKPGSVVTGPCKVGIANRPHIRRNELQVGCPWPIVPLMLIEFPTRVVAAGFERFFHDRYGRYTTNGEWIGLGPADVLRRVQWSLFDYLCTKGFNEEQQDIITAGWGCRDLDFEKAIRESDKSAWVYEGDDEVAA